MKVLILLSPPVLRGPIPQCIAIQAHQPDVVHLIQTLYPGQQSNNHQYEYIQAWLLGSESMLSKFDLAEPFPVPVTKPNGYIKEKQSEPTLFFHVVDMDGLVPKINELSEHYTNGSVSFDLLPGAKEAKLQTLLGENKHLNLTYSTEKGKIIDLNSGMVEAGSSIPLSLIDRFWLSGEPVYVEHLHADIVKNSALYSAIYESLSIELLTKRKQKELIARRTQMNDQGVITRQGVINESEFLDRPLSMFNEGFRDGFECKGVSVRQPEKNSDDLIFEFETGRTEFYPEKKEGAPNGTVLEPLITNLLSKHWTLHDSLTGVSVIYPSQEDRLESYRNLTQKAHDENHEHEKMNQFAIRCENVSLEWKTTSVEHLMEAEFQAIRSGELSVDEALKFIRQVEMDTICLMDAGVLSFDSKAFIRQLNHRQKAMQKPSSLFNNRASGQYYVVSSTSPNQNLNHEPVIHISQLKDGPHVLYQHNKHQWMPSSVAIDRLLAHCSRELEPFLNKPELLEPDQLLFAISRGVGVGPEVLARFFCGDEGAMAIQILDVLVRSDEELKRKLYSHLDGVSSVLFQRVEHHLHQVLLDKKMKENAEKIAEKKERIKKRKIPHKDTLKKLNKQRKNIKKSLVKLDEFNQQHTIEYLKVKNKLDSIELKIGEIKSLRKSLLEEKEKELQALTLDSVVIEFPPLPQDETIEEVVLSHLEDQGIDLPDALEFLIEQYLELHGFLHQTNE